MKLLHSITRENDFIDLSVSDRATVTATTIAADMSWQADDGIEGMFDEEELLRERVQWGTMWLTYLKFYKWDKSVFNEGTTSFFYAVQFPKKSMDMANRYFCDKKKCEVLEGEITPKYYRFMLKFPKKKVVCGTMRNICNVILQVIEKRRKMVKPLSESRPIFHSLTSLCDTLIVN